MILEAKKPKIVWLVSDRLFLLHLNRRKASQSWMRK